HCLVTSPLGAYGCVMLRVVTLTTGPVGFATQNPDLRSRFSVKPEFVVTFFEYIAEEVRALLAELGLRSLDEAIGAVDLLDVTGAVEHWKASGLDLSPILTRPVLPDGSAPRQVRGQDHGLDRALDNDLIEAAAPALERGEPVHIEGAVRNVNRTVGTMLGHAVTTRAAV